VVDDGPVLEQLLCPVNGSGVGSLAGQEERPQLRQVCRGAPVTRHARV
jgi:hypothetical protein